MKTRVLASLVFALALGGCFSVLPEPEIPSALISLPSDRATAPADPLLADVAVYPPDSTRAFAGIDIAVRSDQEMVYLGDVRWVDTAPRLLQGAVVDALAKAGGAGRAAPAQLAARTDYDVRWRIVDLSASKDVGPVRVEVEASLMDSTTRRMIAQETFKAEGTPTDRAPRARAAALAIAAQSVADQVAAFATKNAVAKPPRPPSVN
jgi:cholesterol transport system auxiliary component